MPYFILLFPLGANDRRGETRGEEGGLEKKKLEINRIRNFLNFSDTMEGGYVRGRWARKKYRKRKSDEGDKVEHNYYELLASLYTPNQVIVSHKHTERKRKRDMGEEPPRIRKGERIRSRTSESDTWTRHLRKMQSTYPHGEVRPINHDPRMEEGDVFTHLIVPQRALDEGRPKDKRRDPVPRSVHPPTRQDMELNEKKARDYLRRHGCLPHLPLGLFINH